ncbi:MAG TPA: hypothetical protein VI248_15455 [Kineosporiaceae bacterium]
MGRPPSGLPARHGDRWNPVPAACRSGPVPVDRDRLDVAPVAPLVDRRRPSADAFAGEGTSGGTSGGIAMGRSRDASAESATLMMVTGGDLFGRSGTAGSAAGSAAGGTAGSAAGGTALRERSLKDLVVVAETSLAGGIKAHRARDLPAAASAFRRSREAAALVAVRAPDRVEGQRLQADALCQLADVQLDLGDPGAAQAALDAAEALYSQLGAAGLPGVADTRARRARAHAGRGRGLSALVDVQSAVLHHVQALPPNASWDTERALADALICAAEVQAVHGCSGLALTAAQQAAALLAGTEPGAEVAPLVIRALEAEIRLLRALDRSTELVMPLTALSALAGPDHAQQLLDEAPLPARLGLAAAAQHQRVTSDTRLAIELMLDRPMSTVSIPGLLVEPMNLLEAAREGAATALELAPHEPALALAAGRDAACLYACAEELGLVEHPWPRVRIELARWLWLLSELGWLAVTTGDLALARDLADHAQHPLVRAENGRHLPASIARSVSDSATRLNQLRRTVQ